jgi:pimeloyl-ACP methyl ester carboxylesterase
VNRTRSLAAVLAVTICLLGNAALASTAGEPIRVQGGPWLLAGRVCKSIGLSDHPRLIVVLHGDAPGRNPTYQYEFACRAAAAVNDVVVVGLLRPGYKDGLGDESEGNRGHALGDNYTPEDVASVASAVKTLKDRYHASEVAMVGHSGGSVISADILALYPHLARRALLVSCPCDVPAFRWSMMKYQWNPLWLLPVNAVSPQLEVAKIPKDTIVRMVVGSVDGLTPPPLTLAFEHSLKANGNDVEVLVLPNLGHEIFLERAVLQQLESLMKTAPTS